MSVTAPALQPYSLSSVPKELKKDRRGERRSKGVAKMCEHERDSSRVAALQLFVRSKGVTKRTGVGKRGSNGVANMCEHEPDSSRIVALHYKLQLQLLVIATALPHQDAISQLLCKKYQNPYQF
eukprot:1161385-Pelagomonas_calceolata.AAC.5